MRVGLLGGLEVHDADNRDIVIPTGKQQALLALLAVNVGRVVQTEHVVDALWGEDPPPRVRNGLQALASKLRSALGAAELILMRGGGYVLDLPSDAVDINRFEALVADARAAAADEAERAVALFVQADALWRGDVLADFAYDDFAQPTIARLTELRLAAIEERLDLEAALGGADNAIIELEALVAAHPLRERLRGQLMIALYRAGRQADALQVFQEGRRVLAEELGLDPGPELRRLEAAILAQDPVLDAPTARGAAAQRAGARRGTIPEALTPMIGREQELRELTGLAADNRFISLVGPGGVGKTRLAVEVARVESRTLEDGGYLVELAPVGDPGAVGAAIASALDVPDAARLDELIGDRELLIVLDNCEHVIDAAAAVAEHLLRSCARLRLVVTSREALRVGGETVWPVSPLALDDAEQLFVDRARAAGASFELNDELTPVVADICARLDGLPLAIELAAARSRALPMQQIASRLNDRFRLLTGGSRTALPRQQTLRAVVDWSYELLFDAEQRVFERLSVFPGGCDLATAEAVCADDIVAADDVADLIQALVDKSLVVAQSTHDAVRFTQLQTLAQYGHEKLTARGDAKRMRDAMAAHFVRFCSEGKAAFTGPTQRSWLMTINQERDNVRAALEWAVANDDTESAMVIAGGSSWAHWLAGTHAEGRRWLDDAFACTGTASEPTRALALTGRGLLRFIAGNIPAADQDLAEAREIFRHHADVEGLSFTLSMYAETARVTGQLEEARARRLETLDLHLGQPDSPFVVGVRSYSRAILAMIDGDLASAESHYRVAADGFRAADRPVMLSMTLGVLSDFDERHGKYRDAVEELEEAVELAETVGMRGFVGSLYARLAWSLLEDGDIARAELMIEKSFDAGRRLRSAHILFLAHAAAATLHRLHGRNEAAAIDAAEALHIHEVEGPSRFRNRIDPDFEIAAVLAVCCTLLGVIAAESGDLDRSLSLLEQADRLRAGVGAAVPKFQVSDLERTRATRVPT
ncbi:MAG TPA: BTAD domain-containing putative transcriptional regulator [Acidimicrobiales bacterium]|nr:BTAD domain-containing putative transcriptional regulator [Acidimicrobiales bacterium]